MGSGQLSIHFFSILVMFFKVFFNLKIILSVAKVTQNTVTELLYVLLENTSNN